MGCQCCDCERETVKDECRPPRFGNCKPERPDDWHLPLYGNKGPLREDKTPYTNKTDEG